MNFINGFLSLFYPTQCSNCLRYIKNFKYLYVCVECFSFIKKLEGNLCAICSKPMDSFYVAECLECHQYKKKFKQVKQVGVYEGALKKLIHLLKFHGKRKIADLLFKFIIANIEDSFIDWPDVIVPVPLSRKVFRERGFNQTEIIGKKIAKYKDKLFFNCIKKIRETLPQNRLGREERLKNLYGSFKTDISFEDMKVLIVDDVYTTGATMNEISKVILEKGAVEVRGLAIARSI